MATHALVNALFAGIGQSDLGVFLVSRWCLYKQPVARKNTEMQVAAVSYDDKIILYLLHYIG